MSGAVVGRSGDGGTPRKIHFLPIFSPCTALSRLGWAGVKLRRQGLAGGGRGGLGGLSPQFAVWRYCGQGWAVRRSAVRRRCPFRRQPSAAAVRRRRVPLHGAQRAAVRRRRPPPSAVCRRGGCWGAVPLAVLVGAHPHALPAGGCPPAPIDAPPEAAASRGQGRTLRCRDLRGGSLRLLRLRSARQPPPLPGSVVPASPRLCRSAAVPAAPRRGGGWRLPAGFVGFSQPPLVPVPSTCAPAPCLQPLRGARHGRRGAAASRQGVGVRPS